MRRLNIKRGPPIEDPQKIESKPPAACRAAPEPRLRCLLPQPPSIRFPGWNRNRRHTLKGRATGASSVQVCRLGHRAFEAKGYNMSVLISILITFLVVILVLYLVNMLPIDGRAKQIVRIIVIIIGILSLLKYLGVWL